MKPAESLSVEGYVDAIAMASAGFAEDRGNAWHGSDARITTELLWKMAEEPMLCFDGDKAGRNGGLPRDRHGFASDRPRPFPPVRAAAPKARTLTISSALLDPARCRTFCRERCRSPISSGFAKPRLRIWPRRNAAPALSGGSRKTPARSKTRRCVAIIRPTSRRVSTNSSTAAASERSLGATSATLKAALDRGAAMSAGQRATTSSERRRSSARACRNRHCSARINPAFRRARL